RGDRASRARRSRSPTFTTELYYESTNRAIVDTNGVSGYDRGSTRGGCDVPNALITGITGQDGSYLAELRLTKGYNVYGLVRRTSLVIDERIRHIRSDVELIDGDLLDQLSLIKAIRTARPEEVYNLGAMSFVPTSFVQPVLTGEYTALGVTK